MSYGELMGREGGERAVSYCEDIIEEERQRLSLYAPLKREEVLRRKVENWESGVEPGKRCERWREYRVGGLVEVRERGGGRADEDAISLGRI